MTENNQSDSQPLLYLFSSNARPLYEQDILDLLAAPSRIPYRFRYYRKYVQEDIRDRWQSFVGSQALVHFSLQQKAKYLTPVFVPVRLTEVINAYTVADIFVIEFYPGRYVSLGKPPVDKETGETRYWELVQKYTAFLKDIRVPTPYPVSAGLGPSALMGDGGLQVADNEETDVVCFERTCKYLRNTESFSRARFFRFMHLRELTPPEIEGSDAECHDNAFVLRSGGNYELEMLHSQPSEVSGRQVFHVATDEAILKVIGKRTFDVSSRYDVVTVPIHATDTDRHQVRRTVLIVEPEEGVQGPRLRLPIDVRTPVERTAKGVAGSAATALLLGIPILIPTLPAGAKAAFIIAAAVLTGLLAAFGLRRA